MDPTALVVIALLMVVGLVGVVLPVIPGLLLIAGATVAWAWLEDSRIAWVVAVVVLVVLTLGTIAKYVLPGRSLKETAAPRSTLLLGALGAIIGFVVIPVVGLIVGGVVGVYLGELQRLGDGGGAWRSTWATIKAIGVGMLVELVAGVTAVLIWAIAAWALA